MRHIRLLSMCNIPLNRPPERIRLGDIMLICSLIIVIDAVMILADYRWFAQWSEGRKMLLGELETAVTRSEAYAAETSWRR